MANKKPENKKRKNLNVSIDPRVYEIFKQYCDEHDIENYSEFIEKLITKKLKDEK